MTATAHICSARRAERLTIFICRIITISAIVLKLYFFLGGAEKQFYAEFILLRIRKSEERGRNGKKKRFRYFPSVTWLSRNLKRHKVDSAGPSKCDFKK